ncbi:MAG: hypothetical protein L0G99_15505, partial [Propionibacteriales bacterium]|nr:hypothetical protein [Propionibacteriales bacterium]
ARPLLITYDAAGNRTERAPTTYGNWIAKCANLISFGIDAGTGDTIALPLLEHHAGHWMSLVWAGACWISGVEIILRPDGREVANVSGPELDFFDSTASRYACSLHPLGFGFTMPLPDGVNDWSDDVRGEGDLYAGESPTPDDLAWEGQTLAEVLHVEPITDQILLQGTSTNPLATIRTALIAPLLGGGSSVAVLGDDLGVAGREAARPVATD